MNRLLQSLPLILHRDATIPEDPYPKTSGKRTGCPSSVLSCTAWGFSCLANYFASGELLPRLFTLTCTLLAKNRRSIFCDTFRHRAVANAAPASSTRHAAVWCSDFPLRASPERSSAINETYHNSRVFETVTPISALIRCWAFGFAPAQLNVGC